MQAAGIHHLELILLFLVLLVAGLTTLAQRFKIPYPIVLFMGGVVLSLFPRLPQIALNPDVVFLVVLPPLLFIGGFNTSWRDFHKNIVSILMLAFGLVGFTVVGVALGTAWLIPGFDHRLGAVLGAVVSTTDAIAATAIAKRLRLPRRIVDVLEGESLVNDASGLLALQFSVALVVAGRRPGPGLAMLELLWLVAGGIAIGFFAAFIIHKVSLEITDSPVEITLSLATPYLAYLAAEGIHASGVLATVVCGLFLGRKSSETLSINARIEGSAVWKTLEFGLNGLVFILMGLQLRLILSGIHDLSMEQLIRYGLTFAILVVALRIIWVYPGAIIASWIRRHVLHQVEPRPTGKQVFIVAWTGMRGVLALAAAISLPTVLQNGEPFPQRDFIIFLTFSVIFVTLVLQGLTLPAVIRKLGLAVGDNNLEEQQARLIILNTVLDYLKDLSRQGKSDHAAIYQDMIRHYQARTTLIEAGGEEIKLEREIALARYERNLGQELRALERSTAVILRNEDKINDELLRTIERELDLSEARFQKT
ncbi:MAG TPA: Na+/H+ antiporter [Acidobacteriaceae bacterium]|nr:Na+/H+ antiporter [Acidobacteriaceae bacterium]